VRGAVVVACGLEAMLSGLLRSKIAIQVIINNMRAFIAVKNERR
jgi:hypothetical protein